MSRSMKIDITNRNDYEIDRGDDMPEWMDSFVRKMSGDRTAVEVARSRVPSIVEQMHSIMNGNRSNSPYSSVEEAVQDYQRRTGLDTYRKMALAKIVMAEDESAAPVSDEKKNFDKPELLKRFPAIEHYIHNVIDTNHMIQLPALLFSILEMFGRDGVNESDIDDVALARFINNLIIDKKEYHNNADDAMLGRGVGVRNDYYELHDQNRDPFSGLMPKRMF